MIEAELLYGPHGGRMRAAVACEGRNGALDHRAPVFDAGGHEPFADLHACERLRLFPPEKLERLSFRKRTDELGACTPGEGEVEGGIRGSAAQQRFAGAAQLEGLSAEQPERVRVVVHVQSTAGKRNHRRSSTVDRWREQLVPPGSAAAGLVLQLHASSLQLELKGVGSCKVACGASGASTADERFDLIWFYPNCSMCRRDVEQHPARSQAEAPADSRARTNATAAMRAK
jgi:hypothetical protein